MPTVVISTMMRFAIYLIILEPPPNPHQYTLHSSSYFIIQFLVERQIKGHSRRARQDQWELRFGLVFFPCLISS